MDSKIIKVGLTMTCDEWDVIHKVNKGKAFSRLVHWELNRILPCYPCNENDLHRIMKVVKYVSISKEISPLLLCAAQQNGISPGAFITRFVIDPLIDKENKIIH